MTDPVLIHYRAPGAAEARGDAGKFLQLKLRGQEYLVFAAAELHRYHNQILAHFLEDQAVAHHWVDPERLSVDSPEVTVVGGGRFRADDASEVLELWDDSQAYGRFHEEGLARKIAAAGHPWSAYRVRIC